jgi:tRNA(adenine34) deaminase
MQKYNIDEEFMNEAVIEAEKARDENEIPVGAVIIHNDMIIARAHNRNRFRNNPVMHAEIIAIQAAASILNNERLSGCSLYVTKEPCAMCAGAIVHARIDRLVIGARDKKYGACGSVLLVCGSPLLNHRPKVVFGVLENESVILLKDFFSDKRKSSNDKK